MRSHFSSLQNTINFTLYALLPTLQPQISAAYPVEATSQALQSRSTTGESSEASFQPTPESSVVLSGETPRSPRSDHGPPVAAQETAQNLAVTQGAEEGAAGSNVGQSWASEFSRRENEGVHLDAPSIDGSSLLPGGSVDEEVSSQHVVPHRGKSSYRVGFIDTIAFFLPSSNGYLVDLSLAHIRYVSISTIRHITSNSDR